MKNYSVYPECIPLTLGNERIYTVQADPLKFLLQTVKAGGLDFHFMYLCSGCHCALITVIYISYMTLPNRNVAPNLLCTNL